ncbi:hypothetical protein EYC84_001955 [Monilinia fructicola]|uniref:Uncharacterized protein n=1 Tax=Monilinia fructicola TaxID=38448 RepID=A0A5M9JZA1_MONFR|nr:hypothetical protein EYC84_001955 [Monilinia fructicola]
MHYSSKENEVTFNSWSPPIFFRVSFRNYIRERLICPLQILLDGDSILDSHEDDGSGDDDGDGEEDPVADELVVNPTKLADLRPELERAPMNQ